MSNSHDFVVGKGISLNFNTDDCIIWPLRIMPNGYGVKSDRSYPQRIIPAHRWVWEKLVGPIPEGFTLDHLCRVRSCVNIRHLEPVSYVTNNARAEAVRIPKVVCNHGHDLTLDGATVMVSSGDGRKKRTCRACLNQRAADYRESHRDHVNAYMRAWRERGRSNESV